MFKKSKVKKRVVLFSSLAVLLAATVVSVLNYVHFVSAEQSGFSPDSGETSPLKAVYDSLTSLSHGSTAAGSWGDWGAYWNRTRSAGEWVPTDAAAVTDVKNGITFHSTSRTQLTGTYPNPTSCSTQQYHDSFGSPVTQTTNCTNTLTWTTASPAVTGDDTGGAGANINKDPRTGLIWSQYLGHTGATVNFVATGGSTWNWDGTYGFTVTSANATAGATYTNNGQTFTVVATIAASTSLSTTGTGSPAASGTLTKATGTGDATITFSAFSGTNNVAVGSKTAALLCSERGNGWRLPAQKELDQAYIDGSNFNLTNPANSFWSVTEASPTTAWSVNLSSGNTITNNKATYSYYVRCVR